MRFVLLGIAIIVGLLVTASWLMTSMVIYFQPRPAAAEAGSDGPGMQAGPLTAADFARLAALLPGRVDRVEFVSADDVHLVGWYLPAEIPAGAERWAIILTHGGGRDKSDYRLLAARLWAAGFDVMMPDLRGHGESGPSPAGVTLGITEGRDVAAAAAFLVDQKGIRHIAALGSSLGGVAIVMAAAAEPRIGPLIIESSSHRVQAVFEYILRMFRMPDWVARSWLSRGTTSLALWRMGAEWPDIMGGVMPTWRLAPTLEPRPVLFILGDKDPLVSEADVRSFAGRFHGRTELFMVADAAHGVYSTHPEPYTTKVLGFLEEWRSAANAP